MFCSCRMCAVHSHRKHYFPLLGLGLLSLRVVVICKWITTYSNVHAVKLLMMTRMFCHVILLLLWLRFNGSWNRIQISYFVFSPFESFFDIYFIRSSDFTILHQCTPSTSVSVIRYSSTQIHKYLWMMIMIYIANKSNKG